MVLIIFWINFATIFFFWDYIVNNNNEFKFQILGFITILEVIMILLTIKIFYEDPIKNIKYNIQKFLVWDFKWKNPVKANKSQNNDLNYIIKFFNQTLNTLKNIKEEFTRWREIRWEVEIWKELQEKMINKELIDVPYLNIVAKSKPAWEIWWDSYDIIKSEDNYYIYVWDATWHWVWAWFIMMMVNALISWFSKVYTNWAKILSDANSILKPRVKSNLLMTLLMVRWDYKNKKMYMTWAWHEFLIIYKRKNRRCYKIKSWWIAMWMIKDMSKLTKEREIEFEENDIIVLYSDWITEAINQNKKDWKEKMFMEANLVKAIEESPNMPWEDYKTARWVFNSITIALSKFMWYNSIQLDDITLTTIHYKPTLYKESKDFPKIIDKDYITDWNW